MVPFYVIVGALGGSVSVCRSDRADTEERLDAVIGVIKLILNHVAVELYAQSEEKR